MIEAHKQYAKRRRFFCGDCPLNCGREVALGRGGALGGNRGLRPVPAEKGFFPLDHLRECDMVLVSSALDPFVNAEMLNCPKILCFDRQTSVQWLLSFWNGNDFLEKKGYLDRLKSSRHKSEKCRHVSKRYLERRMAKNLMAKQAMSELRFGKDT